MKKLLSVCLCLCSLLFVSACVTSADNTNLLQTEHSAYCNSLWQDERLAPLNGKVEITPLKTPSFSVLTNDNKPTQTEKEAIRVLGDLKGLCFQDAVNKGLAIDIDAARNNAVLSLLADLHDGKLTYGEFARQRTDVNEHYNELDRQYQAQAMGLMLQNMSMMQKASQNQAEMNQRRLENMQEDAHRRSEIDIQQQQLEFERQKMNQIPQSRQTNCNTTNLGNGQSSTNCTSY